VDARLGSRLDRNRAKVGSFVSARTWNRALSTTVDRDATGPRSSRDRLIEPVASPLDDLERIAEDRPGSPPPRTG
jgi:hypothetical protein